VLQVLAIPAFLAALLLTLVTQFAGTMVFPIIPLYVKALLHGAGSAPSDTGWIFALGGIASAAGSYTAGRLQRRLGLKPLLLAVVGLTAALSLPQAFVGGFSQLLLVRSLAAVAMGGLNGLVGALAAVSSPRQAKGTAFGLMGAVSSLGFGTGPLVGGALAAAIGMRPVFVLAACLIGAIPLAYVLARAAAPAVRGVQQQRVMAAFRGR
jgi:DHA1 family multidrug resistance protein-like MFS transporter